MHEAEFAMTRFALINRSIKIPEAVCFGLSLSKDPIAHSQWGFIYEKNKRKSGRIHLWIVSFFKFIAANLSLTQAVTAGCPR